MTEIDTSKGGFDPRAGGLRAAEMSKTYFDVLFLTGFLKR